MTEAEGMQRFVVTYIQEATQDVAAMTLEDAAAYAKRYAANNRLRVLQVYFKAVELLPKPMA